MSRTKKILLLCLFLVLAGGSFFYLKKTYLPQYNDVPKCAIWFIPTENAPFTLTDQKTWDSFFSKVSTCGKDGLLVYSTTPTSIRNQPMVTPHRVHDLEIRFEFHPEESVTNYKDGSFVNGSYLELDPEKKAGIVYIHLTRSPIEGYTINELLLASFGSKINEVLNNTYAESYHDTPISEQFVLLMTHPEMIGVTMK